MTRARVQLLIAAALFLGWLGWLAWAVAQKGTVQVVSRAQLIAATHGVVADVAMDAEGTPKVNVMVKEMVFGSAIVGEITVKNLAVAVTPLPVRGTSRTPVAGVYFLPLVKLADGAYRIAGLPRSPSLDAATPMQPVIYPWNDDVKLQVAKLIPR